MSEYFKITNEITDVWITDLIGEAVEGGDRHDDQLLRREEVDDEEERGGLQWGGGSKLLYVSI